MKILLLGANGQIGDAVQKLARTSTWPSHWELLAWTREAGDLSQPIELIRQIEETKPDLIWNAAAYTQVDRAETEPALAHLINGKTPGELAQYCKQAGIPLVHYSTDYVYDGSGDEPHLETETPNPLSEYGKSKLAGDVAIAASGCDYLILRTSWVFSNHGKNFVKTMLRLADEKRELRVVSDQVGSPSYAPDLAHHTLSAIQKALALKTEGKPFPSGIYHLCNSGATSWYEFAQAILPEYPITPISTADYPTPAKRPMNSRLSLDKVERTFGVRPRAWQEALGAIQQA